MTTRQIRRADGSVIFASIRRETSRSVASTVEEAVGEGVDLSGADLSGADLSGADLAHARLRGARLRGAALRCADLSRAMLEDADLSDARADDAIFTHPSSREALISIVEKFDPCLSG